MKFCSVQKTSPNITGINTPGLFTTVYWITVPFALVPTSLSAMTLAHGQTQCISCGLRTGSAGGRLLWLKSCISEYRQVPVTPLPSFLPPLTWDMRTLNLPGQPAVRVVRP